MGDRREREGSIGKIDKSSFAAIHQSQIYAHRSARHDSRTTTIPPRSAADTRTRASPAPVMEIQTGLWAACQRYDEGRLRVPANRAGLRGTRCGAAARGAAACCRHRGPRHLEPRPHCDRRRRGGGRGRGGPCERAAARNSSELVGTRRNSSEPPRRRDGGVPAQARAATARRAARPRRPRPRRRWKRRRGAATPTARRRGPRGRPGPSRRRRPRPCRGRRPRSWRRRRLRRRRPRQSSRASASRAARRPPCRARPGPARPTRRRAAPRRRRTRLWERGRRGSARESELPRVSP